MTYILSKLRGFNRDESGSIAMIMAVSFVPLMLMVGLGVDYGRSYQLKNTTASATDAAMIALAKLPTNTTNDVKRQVALETFKANLSSSSINPDNITLAQGGNLPFDVDEGHAVIAVDLSNPKSISLSSIAAVKNSFMPIGDFAGTGKYDKTLLKNKGVLEKNTRNLELVIALDLSGSMDWSAGSGGGTRLEAATDSIGTFLDVLMPDDAIEDGTSTRMGLVPWTFNVRLPASGLLGETVLVSKKTGESRGRFPRPFGCTNASLPNAPKYWERAYKKDGKWTYQRVWSGGKKPGLVQGARRYWPNSNGRNRVVKWGNGVDKDGGSAPFQSCSAYMPLDLSETKSDITTYVDTLRAGGGTDANSGLHWANEMLDPDNPIWTSSRAPFGDVETNQVIVLMSDGANSGQGLHKRNKPYKFNSEWGRQVDSRNGNDETFGSYPLSILEMGTVTEADLRLNDRYAKSKNGRFLKRCQDIRAQGVIIYTIGFGLKTSSLGDRHALKMLEFCAGALGQTEGQYFFRAASADDLESVFERIAAGVDGLRITQ